MIHVGDVGTSLELQFMDYEDVDGAKTEIGPLDLAADPPSEIYFYFQKPDGSVVSKTFGASEVELLQADGDTAPGESGWAKYETEDSFIDQAGTWKLQGYMELQSGKWNAKAVSFQVEKVLR